MKKYFLISLLVFILGVSRIEAMTIKPTGATQGARGSQVEIYLTLTRTASEKPVSAVDGTLNYDNNYLTLTSQSSLLTDWTKLSGVSNGTPFAYANLSLDNLITKTSENIVKLVFQIKENAPVGNTSLNVVNPSATDEKGDGVNITGGSHTLKILSNINTLSRIKIDGESLSNFNSNTLTYNKTVSGNKTSITLSADKTDANSKVEGLGTKNLNYGLNTFKIVVTSEIGTKKEYVLNITREDNRSKVNTLKTLSLSSGNINFNSNTLTYNVKVAHNVEKIKISSTLTDSKSTYVTGFGNREVSLKYGANQVLIKVKAENGSEKTYTLNITREDNRSKVNTLKRLSLSNGNINFRSDIKSYEIKVLENIEKVSIMSELTDPKSKYVTGFGNRDVNLKNGVNQVLVKVQAENGSINTYTLNIIRGETEEEKGKNANIKTLVVKNHEINFSTYTMEYEVLIKNENKLELEVVLENGEASYEINGNENLQNGSVVIIKVTSSDKSVINEYKLNIKEKVEEVLPDDDNNTNDDRNDKQLKEL